MHLKAFLLDTVFLCGNKFLYTCSMGFLSKVHRPDQWVPKCRVLSKILQCFTKKFKMLDFLTSSVKTLLMPYWLKKAIQAMTLICALQLGQLLSTSCYLVLRTLANAFILFTMYPKKV